MVTTRIVTSMQWQIVPIISRVDNTDQVSYYGFNHPLYTTPRTLPKFIYKYKAVCRDTTIMENNICSVAVSRVDRLAPFRSDLFIGLKIRTLKIIIK
jgi:hypothetical protein